jgi:uncharacterized protein (TIGR00730 family)
MNKVVNLSLGPTVAIFGSARVNEEDHDYQAAMMLAERLSRGYISVITGGGPGIMEAANRGCKKGENGTSVGFKIKLPFEDKDSTEDYHDITLRQDQFHFRQTALIENAQGYAAFVGGCGTDFEIFNVFTLMQTGYIPRSEIVLYGTDTWATFEKRLQYMKERGTISPEDISLFRITDDLEEMYQCLKRTVRA